MSVGDTPEEVKAEIRAAIEFHLEGMREDEAPIPQQPGGLCRDGGAGGVSGAVLLGSGLNKGLR